MEVEAKTLNRPAELRILERIKKNDRIDFTLATFEVTRN